MNDKKRLLSDWTQTDGRKRRRNRQGFKTSRTTKTLPDATPNRPKTPTSNALPARNVYATNDSRAENVPDVSPGGLDVMRQSYGDGPSTFVPSFDGSGLLFNDISNSFSSFLGQACVDIDASFLEFGEWGEQFDTMELSLTTPYATADHWEPFTDSTDQVGKDSPGTNSPRIVIRKRQLVEHLHFYRYFGPTAVTPGLKRVAVRIQAYYDESSDGLMLQRQPPSMSWAGPPKSSRPFAIESERAGEAGAVKTLEPRALFDSDDCFPSPAIIPEIFNVFFSRFGCQFPYVEPHSLRHHYETGVTSAFQMNAMAALASRFCHFSVDCTSSDGVNQLSSDPDRVSTVFLEKAKQQMIPLLSFSSDEGVAGLLMLALAEFGERNESGHWMFVGMASRMALDLGLQEPQPMSAGGNAPATDAAEHNADVLEADVLRAATAQKLLFWSVYVLDTVLSAGTGRRPSINKSDIALSSPSKEDMMLLRSSVPTQTDSTYEPLFPQLVDMFLLYTDVLEVLNAPRVTHNDESVTMIKTRKHAMTKGYNSLPPHARLSAENFGAAKASEQSGIFIMLHLYFFMIMIVVLRTERAGSAPSLENKRLLTSMIKATVDTVHLAISTDNDAFLATPVVNQCIYVAACALLEDGATEVPPVSTLDSDPNNEADAGLAHLTSGLSQFIATREFAFLRTALQSMAEYFAGVKYIVAVLDDRSKLKARGIDNGEKDVDLSTISRKIDTFVTVQDPGIRRRYNVRRSEDG